MTRPATRADVARRAGVSTAVVSYVVNGGPRAVAPETASRVRTAIDALSYRPNANARALRKGTTEMLGLVLPDIANPFFAEYALAIEAAAAAFGYVLVVANSNADKARERQIVNDLAGRHVDGLMLCTRFMPADFVDAISPGRPTIFINSSTPVPGYPALGPATEPGARAAVEHLIDTHGRQSVALIIGESGEVVPEPRERGWAEAFRSHDLPPGPIVRTRYSRRGGYEAAAEILSWSTRPSAIFVASDQQASGALGAFWRAGLRCPEDIAIVSFDGTSESEYCWPPLTVVRQPIQEMAEAAVGAVLGLSSPPLTYRQFDTELVIRESCGCTAPATSPTAPG
jgi:LacI family transcriptional regulator